MGFSSIASFIMLFFTLIIVVSTLVLIQGNLVESASVAYAQNERIQGEMRTSIEIINISWNNLTNPDTTTIYLQNTGSLKVDIEQLDVFIDGSKIPRRNMNRTITFHSGSMAINPLHWDPDEIIRIDVYLNLANETHLLSVMTEYGVGDAAAFLG